MSQKELHILLHTTAYCYVCVCVGVLKVSVRVWLYSYIEN